MKKELCVLVSGLSLLVASLRPVDRDKELACQKRHALQLLEKIHNAGIYTNEIVESDKQIIALRVASIQRDNQLMDRFKSRCVNLNFGDVSVDNIGRILKYADTYRFLNDIAQSNKYFFLSHIKRLESCAKNIKS